MSNKPLNMARKDFQQTTEVPPDNSAAEMANQTPLPNSKTAMDVHFKPSLTSQIHNTTRTQDTKLLPSLTKGKENHAES